MTESKLDVPASAPDDPGDVTVALDAARTVLQNGDLAEAQRWLKRAADAAAEAGQDARAFELARAAADFKDSVEAQPPAPVPGPVPVPAPITSAPPPSHPSPPRRSSAPAPGPIRSRPPPPPSARSKPPPPPPDARPSTAPPPPTATGTSGLLPAQSSRPPGEKRPSIVPARPALTRSATPPAHPVSTLPPLSSARVRVSVKSSVRDPNLLLVRLLADGQSAPAGTQEAYLSGSEASGLLHSPSQAT